MIALTQIRVHAPARESIARRRADGKTGKEAIRALKRHLIRILYRLLKRCADRDDPGRLRADRALHHIEVIFFKGAWLVRVGWESRRGGAGCAEHRSGQLRVIQLRQPRLEGCPLTLRATVHAEEAAAWLDQPRDWFPTAWRRQYVQDRRRQLGDSGRVAMAFRSWGFFDSNCNDFAIRMLGGSSFGGPALSNV